MKSPALPGFKSGLVTYGTCVKEGQIIRLKFKYVEPTRKFFDELLSRYKKMWGEPTEFKGDSFGVFLVWKWSFVDPSLGRISMILQHNSQDEDEKMGNVVKLTLVDQLLAEDRCGEQQRRQAGQPDRPKSKGKQYKWGDLIPH